MSIKTIRIRIYGRVQGVFFRAWTRREARALKLDGWVRNRADGGVEAVFSGDEAAVDAMLQKCRRGPREARVERIELAEISDIPAPGFAQIPTG